MRAMKLKKGER